MNMNPANLPSNTEAIFRYLDQADLFPPAAGDEIEKFRSHLSAHGWQTRLELSRALGMSERRIRDIAESLGSEIVRGQAGFKLTAQLDPRSDDLPLANQAADAFISQGKKMVRYGLALKRKLRSLLT